MPDHGKTSLKTKKSINISTATQTDADEIDTLLELYKKQIPAKIILKSCTVLTEKRTQLCDTQKTISQQPFLAAFILWAKEIAVQNTDMINAAKTLLKAGFIRAIEKNGEIWTIESASKFDHRIIISSIRCQHTWPIHLRELVAKNYISFMEWLSKETYGYIGRLEDPDLLLIKGRLLTHPQFIILLAALKDKEQLVAKLLYFGGKRTLEEVLNLQLDAIDFEKNSIRYKSQIIHYPLHIFEDIRAIIGKRSDGRLFLGRQDAPLSRLTIFRNFKEAGLEAGLGKSFLPTALTTGH